MSLPQMLDDVYQCDFDALDREGNSIVLNDKFVWFMKKHFGYLSKEGINKRNKDLNKLMSDPNLGESINFQIKGKL